VCSARCISEGDRHLAIPNGWETPLEVLFEATLGRSRAGWPGVGRLQATGSLDTAPEFGQCTSEQRLGALPEQLDRPSDPSSACRADASRSGLDVWMTLEEIARRGPFEVDDAASH
jgi:hypothetical protein